MNNNKKHETLKKSKMVDLSPIMLNVNELLLSKHKRSGWIKINTIQLSTVYRRHTLGLKIQVVKVKGWEKVSGKQTIRKLEWLY